CHRGAIAESVVVGVEVMTWMAGSSPAMTVVGMTAADRYRHCRRHPVTAEMQSRLRGFAKRSPAVQPVSRRNTLRPSVVRRRPAAWRWVPLTPFL
ncbi:hypothetical protein, partial [Bauldia litoralis]|uniref:hypothetical protein n=1 Tax=Bauldia litoralis TaxID=665467 RepID=UPI0032997450